MTHNKFANIDIALLVLRIGIGIMFIFHGYPKIIGGVKLMLGNKVVDGSISHQLRKIKYTLEQV